MDRRLCVALNGKRTVNGVLRGFDQFMNLVLDDANEVGADEAQVALNGMVVIRGNSIVSIEGLERLADAPQPAGS